MYNLEAKHLTTRQIPNVLVYQRAAESWQGIDINTYAEMIQFMNHVVDTGLDPASVLEQQYTKFMASGILFNKADPIKFNIEFEGDEYICLVVPNIIQSNPLNYMHEAEDVEPTIIDAIVMYFQDSRQNQAIYSPLRPTRVNYIYARDMYGDLVNNNAL